MRSLREEVPAKQVGRVGPLHIRPGVHDGSVSVSIGVETAQLDPGQQEHFSRLFSEAVTASAEPRTGSSETK